MSQSIIGQTVIGEYYFQVGQHKVLRGNVIFESNLTEGRVYREQC